MHVTYLIDSDWFSIQFDHVTYLIDSDWFAIQFDHVHDFYSIVCIFLSQEFHEAISLMCLCDTILWHVYIHCVGAKIKIELNISGLEGMDTIRSNISLRAEDITSMGNNPLSLVYFIFMPIYLLMAHCSSQY